MLKRTKFKSAWLPNFHQNKPFTTKFAHVYPIIFYLKYWKEPYRKLTGSLSQGSNKHQIWTACSLFSPSCLLPHGLCVDGSLLFLLWNIDLGQENKVLRYWGKTKRSRLTVCSSTFNPWNWLLLMDPEREEGETHLCLQFLLGCCK